MEIKFKINWGFVGEKFGVFIFAWFISFLFIIAAIFFGVSIASQNPANSLSGYGNAIELLIITLFMGIEICLVIGGFAPKHSPDGKLTVRGLRIALGSHSEFQPTNIDTLTEEPDSPEKRKQSKRTLTLTGK